jgi:phage head maturation protease
MLQFSMFPHCRFGPQKYREYIREGAFTRSLDGDVVALYDHNPANVLGRTTAGTMKLLSGRDWTENRN